MIRLSLALAMVVLSSACESVNRNDGGPDVSAAVPQWVTNRLALCGAGIQSGFNASLDAKVGKTLQEGGKLSAELKQSIKAAYFTGADTGNANVAAAYKEYVECVERPL